ncbi:MAG: hypothetical protein MUO30_01015 [Anaerolineales bacterium]|nr:hypothetical protein [Anaerolineales bacterium]
MTRFIGQTKIIRELNYILDQARTGVPYNILFSARTGYGKTFLALQVVSKVATYQIFIKEDANEIIPSILHQKTMSNLIDEIHLVRNIELLYPMMDEMKYFLVFATNQSYELPEAFKRRCITMIFEKYNNRELAQIAEEHLQGLNVGAGCLDEVVRASNYTPGNIAIMCIRLRTVFGPKGGFNFGELRDALKNIFNIQDGLDVRCREYLNVLERMDHASLDALSSIMGVSKDTLKVEVESVLLSKGLIQVTSKGRSLV